MAINYTDVVAMRIVKDLLNMIVNDKKRFPTLKNKFKKSIDTIEMKDGVIFKIVFNDVKTIELNAELEVAVNSIRPFFERSSKKIEQLNKILGGDFSDDSKVKPTKAKKVTKPAKEKSPKAKPEKIKTDSALDSRAQGLLDKVDVAIKNFVIGLKDEDVLKLIGDTEFAFAGDAKFNATMENHQKNYHDPRDIAIMMFNTAYTRKPNNKNMAEWYSKFTGKKLEVIKKSTKKAAPKAKKETGPKVKGSTETQKKASKPKETKPKEPVKEVEETKDYEPTQEEVFVDLTCWDFDLYQNSLSTVIIGEDYKNISVKMTENTQRFLKLGERVKYWITPTENVSDHNQCMLNTINNYINWYNMLESDVALEYEGELLSNNFTNCINTNMILNLISIISGALGLDQSNNSEIKSNFDLFFFKVKCSNLKERKAAYIKETSELSQLQTYTLNRQMLVKILKSANDINRLSLSNFVGDVILNSIINSTVSEFKYFNLAIVTIDGDEDKTVMDAPESLVEAVEPAEKPIIFTLTAHEISFVFRDTSFNIPKIDPRFNDIYMAVKENDKEKLNALVETKEQLIENIKDVINNNASIVDIGLIDKNVEVKIVDKKIMYGNKIFGGALSVEFIKYIATNDLNKINSLKNFMYNASLNPSNKSVEELYDFVVANNLRITPSGTILLYKWVQDNYLDTHSKTFLNKPGVTLRMDRKKVNDNRNETCSNGLHLCSWKYGSFGTRLLLCELNPKNSVSIPTDYNKSKMRCCEYTVLMDITEFSRAFGNGDYLSKVQNLHYNTKIIELDLMKMYPEVERKNSNNGFNGLKGSDPKLDDKFNELIAGIKISEPETEGFNEIVEVEDDACDVQDVVEDTKEVTPPAAPEMVPTLDNLLVPEETEKVKETPMEEDPSEETKKQMLEEQVKRNLSDFIANGYLNDFLLTTEVFNKLIGLPHAYNLDTVILDTIKSTNGNPVSLKDKRAFLFSYRNLLMDQVSSAHITEEEISKADGIAPAQEVKHEDNVKVVETPQENVVQKVGSFFKKLFK